jgi:hypothetical protein
MILASYAWMLAVWLAQAPSTPPPAASSLDFEFFKTRVQPIFLAARPGHARCYACHWQGTPMRLQPLSPGSATWNEEESRKNFEAVARMVTSDPLKSPLLLHPLATEAGGDLYHSGGKHWTSKDAPEWQTLASWVRRQPASAAAR